LIARAAAINRRIGQISHVKTEPASFLIAGSDHIIDAR
jgi:hypothetical protein